MFHPRVKALAVLSAFTALMTCSVAWAQTANAPASTSKETRKAERKAARAKRNAELKTLEQHGYKPQGGSNPDYPSNVQKAQRNAASPSAASTQ